MRVGKVGTFCSLSCLTLAFLAFSSQRSWSSCPSSALRLRGPVPLALRGPPARQVQRAIALEYSEVFYGWAFEAGSMNARALHMCFYLHGLLARSCNCRHSGDQCRPTCADLVRKPQGLYAMSIWSLRQLYAHRSQSILRPRRIVLLRELAKHEIAHERLEAAPQDGFADMLHQLHLVGDVVVRE